LCPAKFNDRKPVRVAGWSPKRSAVALEGVPAAFYPDAVNAASTTTATDELAQRMAALGIAEADLEETFVRSGGHGGQNVNKTSTCVLLVHRPTGLQVKCQATRHQGQNRLLARQLLFNKLETLKKARLSAERARLEKARRQKRGRSHGAKQRILADKSHHSAKKKFRRPVGAE
jgi:protein subunit release factor B